MESELAALAAALDGSFAEPLALCADAIQDGFGANIVAARGPNGEAWPPHAPSTVARYGPHPLLQLSGKLREAAEGGPGRIREITDMEAIVGVDGGAIPYAARQNYGGGIIPRREFIFAGPDVLDECERILLNQIEAKMRAAYDGLRNDGAIR